MRTSVTLAVRDSKARLTVTVGKRDAEVRGAIPRRLYQTGVAELSAFRTLTKPSIGGHASTTSTTTGSSTGSADTARAKGSTRDRNVI
jgi:hypothetical protein